MNHSIGKRAAIFLSTAIFCLTGCGDSSQTAAYQVNPVDGENYNAMYGSRRHIMKSDTGFYYTGNSNFDIHYYEEGSRQSVYLCNKPECLHMGDEFCTATSSEYGIMDSLLYDTKLYVLTTRRDEEENLVFEVLRIEPDGSGRTGLVTVAKGKGDAFTGGNLFIHRGILFASYMHGTRDKQVCGMMAYNLLDGSEKELPEQTFEIDLSTYHFDLIRPNDRFQCSEQYVYYNERRPGASTKKNQIYICRYNVETGEVTEYHPSGTYKGVFGILDSERIIYSDSFGNIFTYNFEADEKKEYGKIELPILRETEDGGYEWDENWTSQVGVGDFLIYEGDLYAMVTMSLHEPEYVNTDNDPQEEIYNIRQLSRGMVKLNSDMKSEGEIYPNPLVSAELKKYIFNEKVTEHMRGVYMPFWTCITKGRMYVLSDFASASLSLEDYFNGKLDFEPLIEYEQTQNYVNLLQE